MALGTTIIPCTTGDGSLAYRGIDGPSHIFVNQSLFAKLANVLTSPGNGRVCIVEGFEPCLYIFGTSTSFSIDIYTSPDGKNFVKVATVTQATAPLVFGRNELRFPIYAIAVDVTAVTGGNVSAVVYGERRK